jgi:hypothetical protein
MCEVTTPTLSSTSSMIDSGVSQSQSPLVTFSRSDQTCLSLIEEGQDPIIDLMVT